MRRVPIALALASTLLLGLVAAPAIAASKNQPVGDRISLFDGDQSYPASTAFHVNHGFCFTDGEGNNPAIGRARFDLDVDGTPVKANFVLESHPDGCQLVKFWYFNFPAGMTGTHVLTGHWFVPCDNVDVQCNGAKMHTAVEDDTDSITVTFS